MVDMPNQIYLTVEVDKEATDAVKNALLRFQNAQKELRDATQAIEEAVYNLKRSITAQRKEADDG